MKIFELGGVRFSAIPYSIGLFPGNFTVPLNEAFVLVVSERKNPEWQAQHGVEISSRIKQAFGLPTLHQIMRHYQVADLDEIEYVVQVVDCSSGLSYLLDGRTLWMTIRFQYKNKRRCVILREENPLYL